MSDTRPLPPLSPAEARQIDQTCDRFESAWKAGLRPLPEDYLGAAGEPARSALLRQLLLLDWDYRLQAGEQPQAGEYEARFPTDPALIERVRREMTAPPDSTWMRSGGAADGGGGTVDGEEGPPSAPHQPPSTSPAARYDLVREVGQGGIGVVFRGRDRLLGR